MSPPPEPASPARRAYLRVRPWAVRAKQAPGLLLRRATAARRALPHFLVIGTQKGGTTSLYRHLAAHPGVLPASEKEVHYFDHHYRRGEAWYRSHFPLASALEARHATTGEASPSYLYHPHAPRRIAADLPDARLIAVLRNPVSRAVSQYWHMVRVGRETLPMEEAFGREEARIAAERERLLRDEHYFSKPFHVHSYRSRGHYADQLERLFEHVDRGRVLVLRSEDLFRAPQTAYDAVLAFLGLEPHTLPPRPPRNVGTYREETPESVRDALAAHFAPHNRRLADLLGHAEPWW